MIGRLFIALLQLIQPRNVSVQVADSGKIALLHPPVHFPQENTPHSRAKALLPVLLPLLLKVAYIYIGAAKPIKCHIFRVDQLSSLSGGAVAAQLVAMDQPLAGQALSKGHVIDNVQLRFKGIRIIHRCQVLVPFHKINEHRLGVGTTALLFLSAIYKC